MCAVSLELPALVAQLDAPSDWRPGGRGFNPRRGRRHSFMEIDHEVFSTVILFLSLIQEGQLSFFGERMCTIAGLGGSFGCAVRLETRRSWVNPRRGRQHSFVEIDREIFSTVILSLPLIQKGQLSVSGERMCTILVNRLED